MLSTLGLHVSFSPSLLGDARGEAVSTVHSPGLEWSGCLRSCSVAVAQCMVSKVVGLRGHQLAGLCGGSMSVSMAGWEGACWSRWLYSHAQQ